MTSPKFRIRRAAATVVVEPSFSAAFTPFSVLQGEAEDFVIGEVTSVGYSGSFTSALTSTLGGLIKIVTSGGRHYVKTGAVAITNETELAIAGSITTPAGFVRPFSGTAPVISVTTLTDLALSPTTFAYELPAGAEMADIGAPLPGETRSISPADGRVVFNAGQDKLLRGLTAWTASSVVGFTVTRTLTGASNTPHDTAWSVTVSAAVTPDPAHVVPGTTAFGSWAATVPSALGIATQGTSDQYGYTERAMGCWTTPMFDRVTGEYIAGTTWWKAPTVADVILGNTRGMKEVWYSISNGPWLVVAVADTIDHPLYGNNIFPLRLRSSDFAASGKVEVRAIGVPMVGEPFVLQGIPNPITQTTDGSRRTSFLLDLWSLQLNIDKTGTDLPHGRVYIDTTSGSDANSGATDALPVQSWTVALTKLKAQHAVQGFAADEAGGGEIVMLAGTTTFGVPGEYPDTPPDMVKCTDMPIVVRAYDGASPGALTYNPLTGVTTFTNGDVHLLTSTTYGLRAEKIAWHGFSKACALSNADPGNSASSNYVSTRMVDIYHDGGTALLDYNQQTDGAACLNAGNGFNEIFNVGVYRTKAAGFRNLTLGVNVQIDTHNEWDDPFNNPKALINVECRNAEDLFAGNPITPGGAEGNHLDAYQWWDGRGMVILEDLKATHGWLAQIMLIKQNGGGDHKDFALIRPRFSNNSFGGTMALGVPKMRHLYVLDPQINGPTHIWDSGTPYTTNVRFVMLEGSTAGRFASDPRYGKSVIYPSTLVEPDVTPPGPDALTTIFGTDLFLDLDADAGSTINLVEDSLNLTSWTQATGGVAFLPRSTSPPPTYDTSGLNPSHGTVDLNGINTGTNTGSSLYRGGSNPEIQGNNPVEIFAVLDQRDAITQTSLRWIAAYGGSTNTTLRAIFKGVPAGGRNILRWRVPNTSTSASNTLDAPGDFTGLCVIHCYYNPATGAYGVGLFNAAQPTYDLSYYTTGTVSGTINTGASRHVIGGSSATSGGVQGMWPNIGINRYSIIKRNTTELERETAIEFLLARIL